MRIVHLSDIHVWRIPFNPASFASKRALGVMELLSGRASRFRLERLGDVVAHVQSLEPDHVLITGDLTTTALTAEFRAAREALEVLLADPARATVLPGNHDRYTSGSVRSRKFEAYFGEFPPSDGYPWLRPIDGDTAILGLDPTRSHISARGFLPPEQIEAAEMLMRDPATRPNRLIVACHYPVAAPPLYEKELEAKKITNEDDVRDLVRGFGPHLYCCGHVHAAWAFAPPILPNQICLNSGAPLMRDSSGFRLPGFLEIELEGPGVRVIHHAWNGSSWIPVPMLENPKFFVNVPNKVVARPG